MTEIELIQEAQKWNNKAFWEIYDLYIDKIYNFIYLKTYDREIAEDLTSDVFFKWFEKISQYKQKQWAQFSSWLYRIAYNKVVDFYKYKKEDISLDNVLELGEDNNFSNEIYNKDKVKEVYDFINTLKQEHKEIIIMRLWDNLSYKEIAEITWKSTDNCKKIFSRNLKIINENITLTILILLFI